MAKRYEYDCETLLLVPEQLQALQLGLMPKEAMDGLNQMILDAMNKKGEDGWQVLVPISLPTLFFQKEITTRAGKKTKDAK